MLLDLVMQGPGSTEWPVVHMQDRGEGGQKEGTSLSQPASVLHCLECSVRENNPQDVFPIWNTVLLSGLAPDARPACDFVSLLVMY